MNDLIFRIIEVVLYVLVGAAFRYLIPFLTTQLRRRKYDLLADTVRANLDMDLIYRIIERTA